MFKYPKTFQCDNGSEFKNEVTKLLEKLSVDIRRATTKYKHTHTAFVEAFNKELSKFLFKPMDAQELRGPEKLPKDAINLGTVPLDKISRRNRTT